MLHGTRIASDESAFDLARPSHTAIGEPGSDGLITVPDAHLLFNGDFQRHGSDLKIVGEAGQSFLIPGYFKGEKNPTLLSPEGASLSGEIVEALAGPLAPGQYAQAGQQTSDQPAIGRIEQVAGNATIVRNGVAMAANQGDVVRKGDVVQTGDGMIAVLFSDGSTFSLSANARMVLNDFVYQAGGANNSALISLVQGTIGFVAGQVAKSGDMRVETPVATMGIRGTAVLVEISANDGQTKFSVLVEPDGTTGSYNLYNKTTGTLIGTVNNSGVGWVVSPAGPLQVVAQQVQKSPAELQQELNYFQQIFNIFNQGQQNPFDPSQHTDVNPQSGKTAGTQFLIFEDNNNSVSGNGGNGSFVTVTINGGNSGNNSNNDLLNYPEFINNPPLALPDGGTSTNGGTSNSVIEAGVSSGNSAQPGKPTATGDVLNNDSDPDPGDVITLISVNVVSPVLHGTLQIDSGGAYTYTLDNDDPDTQALAQGETATDVFLYTITDAYGATATATLTIVITGTNDAPVILNGPVTAEFTEAEDETGGESAWSTEGSFGYKDVDISDNNHEVSVAVAATETIEGLNLSNAELLELFNASLTQTGVAGTTADITWEFSAADSLFDYLAEGEDLVLTYTLTLADDYDATDTRTVTITVTGTNDAPVILGEPVSIDFTEAEGQTFALVDYGDSPESPEAFQPAYQTGGTLSFEDVDVSDNNHTLAIAVQTGGDSDGLSLCQQELLELLTTTLNQTGVTGTLGSIDWNFAAPDDAFEYLAEGEELTLTYTLTLTDDEGASTLQTVTVTITGTNDAPVIADTSDTAGSVTESGALAGIEDAGPDGGLEPTITLTNEVTTGLGGLSSNPEDVSTVLATIQSQLNVDLATAITIVWDYLDDAYVSAGPDQININEAFVRLGVEYVEYLQNGGMPLIGVTAKYTADGTDEGDAPDRVQSLHDNLLGNLTDDALTQRFGTDAPLHAELTALVTATDPELLTRPYYGGYEGSSDEDVRDWDANHDYDAPTATGQLAASDVDNGASLTWSAATTAGTYGTFAIDASTGKWTYQLDDSLAATQALATGETDIETFTVTVTDEYGATDTIDVTITVNGTNDAAAEEPSGTVTVTVETDEGYNIEELYDQLFNSDVLQISASHIKLQHTSESLYFWITTENLVWSPVNWGQEQQEQEDITLLDGIITGIEIFSDGNLQEPVASFDGFNIDAAELQEAIDIYDGVEGETSGDTSALDAIFDAYSYDMTGGAGPDTLTGADQNDTIEGSGGDDVLTGDLGADRFIFGEDDGEDTITDFNINDDTIVFVSEFGTVSYETFLDDQDFETWAEDNLHDVAATQDTPAGVEIEIGDGQTIFLENVQSQQLTRGHFDFVGS